MRLIESEADIAEGLAALPTLDARLGHLTASLPVPPLRRKPNGYATLLNIITGQLVSTAAASAIWSRIEAAGLHNEDAARSRGVEALKSCGLSGPKAKYGHAIASQHMDWAALATATDQDAFSQLVALPGVGRWTAEVYLLTALGRADVFPAGDLALQEAARLMLGHKTRPTEAELREEAAKWSPWRAVAARLLWAYYRDRKTREGLI